MFAARHCPSDLPVRPSAERLEREARHRLRRAPRALRDAETRVRRATGGQAGSPNSLIFNRDDRARDPRSLAVASPGFFASTSRLMITLVGPDAMRGDEQRRASKRRCSLTEGLSPAAASFGKPRRRRTSPASATATSSRSGAVFAAALSCSSAWLRSPAFAAGDAGSNAPPEVRIDLDHASLRHDRPHLRLRIASPRSRPRLLCVCTTTGFARWRAPIVAPTAARRTATSAAGRMNSARTASPPRLSRGFAGSLCQLLRHLLAGGLV